jgi:ribonuclease Z
MHLVFLGTSAAVPTQTRNLPAVALRLENGHLIIFDTGEDVQRRLEAANLRFNVPTTICISHLHGDHLIGILGLLCNYQMGNRTAPLTVIGPQGIAAFLLFNFPIIGLRIMYPIRILEISNPQSSADPQTHLIIPTTMLVYDFSKPEIDKPVELSINQGILLREKDFSLEGVYVSHTVPTLGYRLVEAERDGLFNPDKARELNIPEGKLWGQLQKGKHITLPDGRIVDPRATGIVGEKRPGNIVVYTGDTGLCPGVEYLMRNADYVICEATFGDDQELLAIEKHHLTGRQAASLAKRSGTKHIYLTHFSGRYKEVDFLLTQARELFPESYLAYDLLSVEIKPKDE